LDGQTAGHCQRVAGLSVRFATALGIDGEHLGIIRAGALFHDVGKVAVPLSVLRKPGPLDPAEWERVRAHPETGEAIAAAMGLPRQVQKIVRHHHERWDGEGYPDRLSGTDIPRFARIVCIADAFDALVSPRSYDPAHSVSNTLGLMAAAAGRLLDPDLFQAFSAMMASQGTGPGRQAA
jgi:putative nucleotidyltransferase with HDIG domain